MAFSPSRAERDELERRQAFGTSYRMNRLVNAARSYLSPIGRPAGPVHRILLSLWLALLTACQLTPLGERTIVTLIADGLERRLEVPFGSTVAQALQQAGLTLGPLDLVEPPLYAVLRSGDQIRIRRVQETFVTEEVEIPFEKRLVRSEALPEGEMRLLTPGQTGLEQRTWRILIEDGVETSRTLIKTLLLRKASPEILMIGARSAFAPLSIPGKLALLAGGNAWIMEGTTGNRRPLVAGGDLDGRVFALSPKGDYLLFTRRSTRPRDEEINTLWVVRTDGKSSPQAVTGAANIVHPAGWLPSATATFGYSTAEPRLAAPGWQANNDFYRVFLSGGKPAKPRRVVETNSGGIYGWWGTIFSWSTEGRLLYARPDGIGLVDQEKGILYPVLSITPFQTNSDWAWIPPLTWSPDGRILYLVTHAPAPPPLTPEGSPYFDLIAYSLEHQIALPLAKNVGMFAYPSASSMRISGKERAHQLAYLQAIFPEQSETSRYRVVVMDRDGSNRRVLFPPADAMGLEPHPVVWAPQPLEGQVGDFLAVIYQGNLWLVDSGSGQAFQITNDGMITRIDWK